MARPKERFDRSKIDGMTLMIVPHRERNIVKIRINYRILYFIGFLVALSAIFALSLFLISNNLPNEKTEAEKIADIWQQKINILEAGQDQILDKIENFKRLGLDTYGKVWPKPKKIDLPPAKSLSAYLGRKTEKLNRTLHFIAIREKAYFGLPLGWPVEKGRISSLYGHRKSPFGLITSFHSGTDFAAESGTPIYATGAGIVTKAGGGDGGWGLHVRILHDHGIMSLYAHCSRILVRKDQVVKRGQLIANVGRTGNATGYHIHYEVRIKIGPYNDVALNPLHFIREKPQKHLELLDFTSDR